jgi:integrase
VFLRMSLPTMEPSARCKARARCWTLEEARRFILDDLLPLSKRIEVLVTILIACRGGEVRASEWVDYRLDAELPFVSISKSSKAKRKIGSTKTKTTREVPLHAELVTVLRAYHAHLGQPTGLVFPRHDGEVQGQPGAGWKSLCAAADVPAIVFHGLRHTGGTLLADAGVDETDIGAIMGHKSKTITGHYARKQLPRLSKAVAMLTLLGDDAARVVPQPAALAKCDEDEAPSTVRDVAPDSRAA